MSTRDRIIQATQDLFAQKGLQSTSLADIAMASNISRGTLFYHFRSKDDLIIEIARAHIAKIQETIIPQVSRETHLTGLRETLKIFLEKILESDLRNRLHIYLVEEACSRNPSVRVALQDLYVEWHDLIRNTLAPLLAGKADAMATVVVSLADGLMIQASLGHKHPDLDGLVRMVIPDNY